MKTYRAGYASDADLRRELASIEEAAQRADPHTELQYLPAEPQRVRAGMLILADGTNFDPGSGAGLYRRNESNTSWVFIG